MPSGLRGWLGRLGQTPHERENADRRRDADAAGVRPIAECADRRPGRVEGTLTELTVQRHGKSPWLEAQLVDDSGEITLVWMGRSEIAGIQAGRRMRVEGRISLQDGRARIYNPVYTLL